MSFHGRPSFQAERRPSNSILPRRRLTSYTSAAASRPSTAPNRTSSPSTGGRPNIEVLGTSNDGVRSAGGGYWRDAGGESAVDVERDGSPLPGQMESESSEDSIESLRAKLAVEHRIQYGAEQFLDALDSPESSIPQESRPDLRSKVNAQLEITNGKIAQLEEAIERRLATEGGVSSPGQRSVAGTRDRLRPTTTTTTTTTTLLTRHANLSSTSVTSPLSMGRNRSAPGGSIALSSPGAVGERPDGPIRRDSAPLALQTPTPGNNVKERESYFSSPGSIVASPSRLPREMPQQAEGSGHVGLAKYDFSPGTTQQPPSAAAAGPSNHRSIHRYGSTSTLASSTSASSLSGSRAKSFGEEDLYADPLTPSRAAGGRVRGGSETPTSPNNNGNGLRLDPRHYEALDTAELDELDLSSLVVDDVIFAPGFSSSQSLRLETADPEVVRQATNQAQEALRSLKEMDLERKLAAGPAGKTIAIDRAARAVLSLTEAIKRHEPVKEEIDFEEVVRFTQPYLAEPYDWRMRTACFRLYRYALPDRQRWASLRKAGIEWILTRLFARAARQYPELEEAIKLLRRYMILPEKAGATISLAQSVISEGKKADRPALAESLVRLLTSIAENPEDSLQPVCLETLTELALIDLRSVIQADALRVLLQAIDQGPYDLSWGISAALLSLLDSPRTRNVLPKHSGIDVILSGFTQPAGKGAAFMERLTAAYHNVGLLMRSWSGLFYACRNGLQSFKTLVETLRVPVAETREVIIDLLVDTFQIPAPQWYQSLADSKKVEANGVNASSSFEIASGTAQNKPSVRIKVVEQYCGMLLAILVEAGLLDALTALLEENPATLTRKATFLLGELLKLASRVLPFKYALRVQALPRLFELASESKHPQEKVVALSALSSVYHLSRDREDRSPASTAADDTHTSNVDPVQYGQRQLEQSRMAQAMHMDDRQFQGMLVDCQIMYTKDHTKWNYALLLELVEGPLRNSRRLEEAFKVSKFGRRLLSFLHPYNRRFADIKKTRPNRKWIRLATALIDTLLSTEDGIRILYEDKLLRQIADSFAELDQYAGQPSPNPFFSKSRIENTLSVGYFDMLGVLSKHPEGIKLMEAFTFFTHAYHLCELRSRDDIIKAIVEQFDYTNDGQARVVLSKALTSNYVHTRIYMTKHLGKLLQRHGPASWILELLTTQLYDTSREVAQIAAGYLQVACESEETLRAVVQLRPALDHLGDIGQSLLMRFLSTAEGFGHLMESGYIEREVDAWFIQGNLQYVIQIETCLSAVFAPIPGSDQVTGDSSSSRQQSQQIAPLHLYGELAKTDEGCRILRERGHYVQFASYIREHGFEATDAVTIHQLKSAIWAVGHIGSTAGGLPLLEDDEIVEHIVNIAEQSQVLSVRGTCFFVLGLIASTVQGSDLLEDYGWLSATDVGGRLTAICIPDDLSDFVEMPSRPEDSSESKLADPRSVPPLPSLEDANERRILADISSLGNYVLASQAMRSLARLRSKHREAFASVRLYHRAITMINHAHFKQPVRTFVCDMFDIKLDLVTLHALNREQELVDRHFEDMKLQFANRLESQANDGSPSSSLDAARQHQPAVNWRRSTSLSRVTTVEKERERDCEARKVVMQPKVTSKGGFNEVESGDEAAS